MRSEICWKNKLAGITQHVVSADEDEIILVLRFKEVLKNYFVIHYYFLFLIKIFKFFVDRQTGAAWFFFFFKVLSALKFAIKKVFEKNACYFLLFNVKDYIPNV